MTPLPRLAALALVFALPGTCAIRAAAQDAPAGSNSAASIADSWVVPPVVASGTRLPEPPGVPVVWRVDDRPLANGVLVHEAPGEATVRLTGTAADVTKTFTVRILGRDARRLIGYARTPTDVHDANQPVVARSLHLALGGGAGKAVPLNGNYGVVFASGDYVGVDQLALRGLSDPSLFYFADGTLGVIAARVEIDGTPDPAGAVVFKAGRANAAEFVEMGVLPLSGVNGLVAPRAVWDSAAGHYLVAWRERSGASHWAVVRDLARTERVTLPLVPTGGGSRTRIAGAGNIGVPHDGEIATIDGALPAAIVTRLSGSEPAATLPITADMARLLTARFGRIVNTHAHVAPQTIGPGGIAALAATRVQLDYSDGSTATRAVDWNADDLRRVARARSGRFLVRGTVRQPTYPQVFAYNRADPTIYRYTHDGRTRYLFVATDDTGNDNVGSYHLPIRVADSIAALSDAAGGRAREVDLLNRRTRRDRTTEGRTIAGCYWAPEIHEIGGRLSILFAPCFNAGNRAEGGDWKTVEAHIMQLRDGGDPGNPADWSAPAAVRKADGTALGRPGYPANISLDMSYFESGGQAYYLWSQRYLPASGALGDPLTWIAKVDPARPTRLISDPKPIVAPSLSFEEHLSEGGFVVGHGGYLTLVYSGSGVSPSYVVGGVRARMGDDLTDIGSWRKWSAPLQKSEPMPAGRTDYLAFEQGPGHGAFTQDENGNLLYVYHTWGNGVGGDGRDTRLRRVHWAADGRPILDMSADEEVAPANRAIVMQVTVRRRDGDSAFHGKRPVPPPQTRLGR